MLDGMPDALPAALPGAIHERTKNTNELTDVVFPTVDNSDVGNAQGTAKESDRCAAPRHDDLNAYNHYGCRCDAARKASRADHIAWERRRAALGGPLLVDPTGTRRRIQGLRRLGWPLTELAHRLGYASKGSMTYMMNGQRVHIDTARKVAALYEELSMRRGGPADGRAARWAESQGWVAPLGWDEDTIDDPAARPWSPRHDARLNDAVDEVAISRRLGGDRSVRLTAGEKREALRVGLARGRSENELLALLGLSWRSAGLAKAGVAAFEPRPSSQAS